MKRKKKFLGGSKMIISGNYCRRLKSWVTATIATHKAISSAHHIKYTDAEVDTIVATHTAVDSAHHTNHEAASAESAEFKDVNIPTAEKYKQGGDPILFVGEMNKYNVSCGVGAGLSLTTGYMNTFFGRSAGQGVSSGYKNNAIGYEAGYGGTQYANNFMGRKAGRNCRGNSNIGVGSKSCISTSGHFNTCIGTYSGAGATISYCTFIGNYAGSKETGNNKLIIDCYSRVDEADGRIKALIYGIFAPATANQLFRINGMLELTEIKSGSTQANAGAGANEVWKTNGHATLPDNVLMIGV